MGNMRRLTILGSTGSVGVNTLDVIALHPGRFEIVALTARSQTQLLFEQCLKFQPRFAVVLEPSSAEDLRRRVRQAGLSCEVLCGLEALEEVAAAFDMPVVIGDSALARRSVTAWFEDQSFEQVLSTICAVLGVECSIGDTAEVGT